MKLNFTSLIVACAAVLLSGCTGSTGGAIPVELYKEAPTAGGGEYIIGVGDMLSIQVWDQTQMSGKMRVRSDGRISVPFLNDVDAAGKTPGRLATDIEAGLKAVVLTPRVTVVIEESKPLTISVLGEVAKPGQQPLERETSVAHALAAAGGLTTFAHKDRIFVVRSSPKPVRIRFTYDSLTRNVGPASLFVLKAGDVIVVE